MRRRFATMVLGVAFSVAVAAGALAAEPPGGSIRLPAVPLAGLEPPVAEQLASLRDWVEEAMADPGVPAAELAERVGELARHYHAYTLADAAEAAYRLARRLAPGDFRWGYLLAFLLQGEGRLTEAGELYEWCVVAAHQATPAWFRLGEVYRDLGRPGEAAQAFAEVLRRDPASAAALAALAGLALAAGDPAQAVALYERALELVPGANLLYYPLAQAYRAQGDLERAQELLARKGSVGVRMADPVVDALSELTTGSRINLLRGQAAHRAGQFEAAAAQFAAAVEADPESVPARVNLAASLAALGRVQEAASVLEEALALAPGNATAHFNLARLLEFAGDARAAAGQYEEAARYAPRDGEILYHWAETLAREGRLEEAIARYRESISAAPPGERARVGEAIVLSRLGQRVEALGRLEEARSLLPRSRRVARELAWFLATSPTLTLRDGNRAMALATPLHSAQPTLDHAVVLAVALAEAGRCEEASSLLRQALHEARGVAGEEIQSWRDELERWAAGPPCRPLSG